MSDCTVLVDGPFAGYHSRCGCQECRCGELGIKPPAAGPWVKIEPGCEMPEDMEPLICARGKKAWTGWRRDGEWCDQDGLVRDPTHYAVLRMPEAR